MIPAHRIKINEAPLMAKSLFRLTCVSMKSQMTNEIGTK